MVASTKGVSFVQQMTLEEALGVAASHHRSGNYPQAESIYRQILAHDPQHPRATFGLGGLAVAGGRFEDGLALVQRAISLDPADPQFYAAQGTEQPKRCFTCGGLLDYLTPSSRLPAHRDPNARMISVSGVEVDRLSSFPPHGQPLSRLSP